MSKLTWDNEGERLFETGVSEVALYPFQTNGYTKGVAWNGVSSITDSPGGAESNKIYADNIEYLNLMLKQLEELSKHTWLRMSLQNVMVL